MMSDYFVISSFQDEPIIIIDDFTQPIDELWISYVVLPYDSEAEAEHAWVRELEQ